MADVAEEGRGGRSPAQAGKPPRPRGGSAGRQAPTALGLHNLQQNHFGGPAAMESPLLLPCMTVGGRWCAGLPSQRAHSCGPSHAPAPIWYCCADRAISNDWNPACDPSTVPGSSHAPGRRFTRRQGAARAGPARAAKPGEHHAMLRLKNSVSRAFIGPDRGCACEGKLCVVTSTDWSPCPWAPCARAAQVASHFKHGG